MQKRKLLTIGAGVTGTAVAALLIAPNLMDWSKYQAIAQQKLEDATGYNLAIGGKLSVGILPAPHASVSDVTLKKTASADPFLTFKNADIHLALLPLLTGHVEISSVTLEKPVVTLVTNKDGTDNFKPKTKEKQIDAVTGEEVKDEGGSSQSVSVGSLKIEDGSLTVKDMAKGTVQTIGFDDLRLRADTLSGPFAVDGTVIYGGEKLEIDASTGAYAPGQNLQFTAKIEDAADRGKLRWSGVASIGDKPEVQGEFELSGTDIAGLVADTGLGASVPLKGDVKLKGMVTASPSAVKLDGGKLTLGKAVATVSLNATGLDTDAMTVTGAVETPSMIELDPWLEKTGKAASGDAGAIVPDARKNKSESLIPAIPELPKGLNADIKIRAAGLEYAGKKTGTVDLGAKVNSGNGELHAVVASLPGGGDLDMRASAAGTGIDGTANLKVSSLKTVLTDWLGVVDADVFKNPDMPARLGASVNFKAARNGASADILSLDLGDTKLIGSVAYIQANPRPVLEVKLAGDALTLKGGDAAGSGAGQSDGGKPASLTLTDKSFSPPQLPFDLKFDLSLARFNRGDLSLGDVRAAGSYDGAGVTLSAGNATLKGGTLDLTGRVSDLKNLTGVDVTAGLKTSDLETFVREVTGKPLALSKPVGAFSGTASASGDSKKLDVNATAKALGFTVEAAGTLTDPLSGRPFGGDKPSAVQLRLRHQNFVEAARIFSPGFGNTGGAAAKPVDITGLIKIAGNVYAVENLKGTIGGSDVAGSVKADMGGNVPSIVADISSNRLDAGALVGVDSDAPKSAGASGGSSSGTASTGLSPWSREALDTGFLKALNLDVRFNAQTLLYGTWTVTGARSQLALKDGSLKLDPVAGNLYGGALNASLTASAAGDKAPLNVAFKADADKVDIGSFLSALTSSSTKKADGVGSVSVDIKGAGISSAALVSSLNGKIGVKAQTPIVYGVDIDQLAADIVEAFDGGWKGVISGFAGKSLSGGKTEFKDVDQSFVITGGEMPIKDFTLETTRSNAIVNSNGYVSFPRFTMDVQSDVKVTQPKDVPVISMRIAGSLGSPSKSVNSQALDSLIRSKVGDQVNKLVGDKLKDSKAGAIVNQFLPGVLGGGTTSTQDSGTTTDQQPAQTDDTQTQQTQQPSVQQQLLNGVLNQLVK